MASKYDKMFPTRKQNQQTAQKAAESHRDILFSQRNVFQKKTQPLSEKYLARKRRKRKNAPRRADFSILGICITVLEQKTEKLQKKELLML